jgi:hypothetical protein
LRKRPTDIRSEQLENPFGQFAAVGDNILGCESVAQGEMLEEKTSVRKSREKIKKINRNNPKFGPFLAKFKFRLQFLFSLVRPYKLRFSC